MTLQEITMPVDVVWARQHALVFASDMAQRLVQVQDEIGDTRYRLEPQLLTDGRYMCNADLLTECLPGGFLHAAFTRLDASRFGEIEVVPMAEVIALLPQPEQP